MTGSLLDKVRASRAMGDARHKAPYPEGRKLQGTKAWAQTVDKVLADNLAVKRAPETRSELADDIGADKTGLIRFLNKLLEGQAASSKFVEAICKRLSIDLPMVDTPSDPIAKKLSRLIDAEDREVVEKVIDQLLKKRK